MPTTIIPRLSKQYEMNKGFVAVFDSLPNFPKYPMLCLLENHQALSGYAKTPFGLEMPPLSGPFLIMGLFSTMHVGEPSQSCCHNRARTTAQQLCNYHTHKTIQHKIETPMILPYYTVSVPPTFNSKRNEQRRPYTLTLHGSSPAHTLPHIKRSLPSCRLEATTNCQ